MPVCDDSDEPLFWFDPADEPTFCFSDTVVRALAMEQTVTLEQWLADPPVAPQYPSPPAVPNRPDPGNPMWPGTVYVPPPTEPWPDDVPLLTGPNRPPGWLAATWVQPRDDGKFALDVGDVADLGGGAGVWRENSVWWRFVCKPCLYTAPGRTVGSLCRDDERWHYGRIDHVRTLSF